VLFRSYEIINRRYLSGRPMIVTTNLTLEELKHADRDDERIHDRVLERCVPVCFNGPSLRRENAARKIRRARALLESQDGRLDLQSRRGMVSLILQMVDCIMKLDT